VPDGPETYIGIMNAENMPILQRSQRNAIITAIRAIDLDPREFIFDDSSTTEIKITHQRSSWWFIVTGGPGHYIGRYTLAEGLNWPYEVYSWQSFLPRVEDWLESLKRDLNTPDLWAELRNEADLLGAGSSRVIENTPFTQTEQREIERRLDKLRTDVIHAHSLSGAQTNALEGKIDYLIEASTRLGRKDWLNTFIGVTLPFVLSVALAPEAARALFLTFLRSVGLLYPELLIE
jgi:hypothetical protein